MARYARKYSSVEVITELIVLVLLVPFLPSGHQMVGALVVLGVFICVGYGVFANFRLRSPERPVFENPFPAHTLAVHNQTPTSIAQRLRSIDWFQFEQVVAMGFRRQGYIVESKGGANPDGGIDLLLTDQHDQRIAVQCKHWKTWRVGVKVVRELLGAMTHERLQHGIVVSVGRFTADAELFAAKHDIRLIGETEVLRLIKGAGAEIDSEIQRLLNDSRKFCPRCRREMVVKTARKGIYAGSQFWGCSRFPTCKFKMPLE